MATNSFGERAGRPTAMLEERELPPRPAVKKKLCADYHGCSLHAAAAARRDEIVPEHDETATQRACHALTNNDGNRPTPPPPPRVRPEHYSWATLMQRAFEIDVLQCLCGGRRRLLSLVCDPTQLRRILEQMGLPADSPEHVPPQAVRGVMQFQGGAGVGRDR